MREVSPSSSTFGPPSVRWESSGKWPHGRIREPEGSPCSRWGSTDLSRSPRGSGGFLPLDLPRTLLRYCADEVVRFQAIEPPGRVASRETAFVASSAARPPECLSWIPGLTPATGPSARIMFHRFGLSPLESPGASSESLRSSLSTTNSLATRARASGRRSICIRELPWLIPFLQRSGFTRTHPTAAIRSVRVWRAFSCLARSEGVGRVQEDPICSNVPDEAPPLLQKPG